MKILLRDLNAALVDAWRAEFAGATHVEISHGHIFGPTADAIVSPANSFGFMDGGIDLVYSEHSGWGLETRLRDVLRDQFDGELPVGQAVVVPTGTTSIPWLISAPTMRVPMDVSRTVHAFLAFRAVLRAVRLHNTSQQSPIETILCPGLGTAVGRNPISFVVPCHRVLGKSGSLTGYHWGLTRKQAILGWEAGVAASA